jgi:pentatricopeptide repeat protein
MDKQSIPRCEALYNDFIRYYSCAGQLDMALQVYKQARRDIDYQSILGMGWIYQAFLKIEYPNIDWEGDVVCFEVISQKRVSPLLNWEHLRKLLRSCPIQERVQPTNIMSLKPLDSKGTIPVHITSEEKEKLMTYRRLCQIIPLAAIRNSFHNFIKVANLKQTQSQLDDAMFHLHAYRGQNNGNHASAIKQLYDLIPHNGLRDKIMLRFLRRSGRHDHIESFMTTTL